jgi:hypothetical protein
VRRIRDVAVDSFFRPDDWRFCHICLPGFYTVSLSVPAGWNGWCSGSGTDNNGEHPNLFYFASPSWEDYYATWFDNHLTAVSDPLTSC